MAFIAYRVKHFMQLFLIIFYGHKCLTLA